MEAETSEKENLEKFIQHGFKMFSSTLDIIMDSKEELRKSWPCSVVGDLAGGVVGVCVAIGVAHLSIGGAQMAMSAGKKGKSLAEMPFLDNAAEQYEIQRKNILTWTQSKDGNETQFLRTVSEGLAYICVAYKDQIQMFHNNHVNNNTFFEDVFRRIFNYMKNHSRNLDTPLDAKEFYNTFINGRSTPQPFKKQIQHLNTKKIRGLDIEAKENAATLNTEDLFEGVGVIQCDSETNKNFALKINEDLKSKIEKNGRGYLKTDFRLQYDFETQIPDEKKITAIPGIVLEENVIKDDIKIDWRLNNENVRKFVENISRKVNTKKELGGKWWSKPNPLPNTFYERKPDTEAFLEKMKNILDRQNKVVVSGFVGVGKTAITKRFAQEWENSYEHIFWIDCTGEGLKKSFLSLAEKLKIESCDKMKMSQVATHCFNVLKDFLCLWIFDDATGYNCQGGIKDILPESNKSLHLIITSRNKDWGTDGGLGQIQNIHMTPFTDEEAFEFMSSNIGEIKVHEQKMRFLISLLGNLPLALQISLKYLTQKRKSLSDLIEMIKEKAGIIEENFDDYTKTIKDSMKMYLEPIDPSKEQKEKLGRIMLLYFSYITADDVSIDFFRTVAHEKIIDGADLLEQHSLVTKTEHPLDSATKNLTTSKFFSIHPLLQLVIRHSTEIKQKNAVIQKILNCENFTHYKLLPYFMSDSKTQNKFRKVKSAIIRDMDLKELFLNKKLMEAEILSRLIYYDSSPPTKLATYNYALCLQHNQDSDDAIVLFENLYDNIIEISDVNNLNFQPSIPSDRHQYYFGVFSSQESDPNIEILAGQLFVLYFNNNNNKHEADKKINTLIQNTAVIFQCKSNMVVEVLEFLVQISNFSFKYDGQKANALLQSNNIGKKFELSNCYINENIILAEMKTHRKLQELELTKVMTSPNFFCVFKQPNIPKLTFRNMVVDMSNDLTAEEITLEKVTVLAWNQAKWNTNKLTLQNVVFLEQTDIIVNELIILDSAVNALILPKTITVLTLKRCRLQPVLRYSPLAIKVSCSRLQECTFNSVTFKNGYAENMADFDISYSIQSYFLCLKKLTLDCSTQECTRLSVSTECLRPIACLNLNACDLIVVSSQMISPKQLTVTNVKLFKNSKENDESHILVNDFIDFHQMQKLNLEGMSICLDSGCVSESDDHQNIDIWNEMEELALTNMKFTAKDGNELDKFEFTSSTFPSLKNLMLQGNNSTVSLKQVVDFQSIHLSDCRVIIPKDLTTKKPKPLSLELLNVSFFDTNQKLLENVLLNDFFNFSKIQKLKLDGPMSIDLREKLEVREVYLKSVKVSDWKIAEWKIHKLHLENVSEYEKAQIWTHETIIDGESYFCKAFCRKLGEGQRNPQSGIVLEDFTVSAMGAFRIKKILQSYAELEKKWKVELPKTLGLSADMQGQLTEHQGGFGSLIFKTLKFWRISKGKEAKFNGFVEAIRHNAKDTVAADQLLENKDAIRMADMIDANIPLSAQTKKYEGVGNEKSLLSPLQESRQDIQEVNKSIKTSNNSGKELRINKKLQELETIIMQSNLKVVKTKDDLKCDATDVIIVLKTSPTLPMQTVSRFLEFSNHLAIKEVHTAITLPNIDNAPCLIVKTKSREEVYPIDSILFVLDILLVGFDCASDLSQLQRTFYHLAACIKTEKLPLCKNSDEVFQLIEALWPLQKIKFCSTCVQTMSHLIIKDDKWKVVITLDAEISAYEATKKMLFLSKYYEKVFGEFLVGSFGIKHEHDAPLSFIFRNGKLEEVILDNLDMHILDTLSKVGESIDSSMFTLLSTKQVVDNSLYPKKASYTECVMSLFGNPSNNECNSDISKVFPPPNHEFLQNAMKTVQGYLQSNKNAIIYGMGNICQVFDVKFQPVISKHNARMDAELDNYDGYDEYVDELIQNYGKTNSLIAKLMHTLDSLNCVDLDGEEGDKLLNEKIKDKEWPEDIRKVLSGYSDMPLSAKIENVTLFLKNCFHKNINEKKQNCQITFLECLKILNTHDFVVERIKEKLLNFLHYAIDQNVATTDLEKEKQLKFITTIRENNFYSLAKVIASTQENDILFLLKQELEKLNKDSAMKIINIIADNKLNESQSQVFWRNPKLCFLFEQEMMSNKNFIPTIYHKLCKQKIPAYLPDYIVNDIKLQCQESNVEMPSEVSNFDEMRAFFQNILHSGHLPDNFREFLRKNLEINPELQAAMTECGALPFWNGQYFTDVWRISTVDESLKNMNSYMDTIKRLENKNKKKRPLTLQCHTQPKEMDKEEGEILALQVLNEWVPLVGAFLNFVKPANFLNLRSLKNIADVKLFEEDLPIKHLLPFFLQRLKTWGTTVLHPQNLNSLMPTPVPEVPTKPSNSNTNTGALTARQRMELRKQEKAIMTEVGTAAPSKQASNNNVSSTPLSRIDILTIIIQCCSSTIVDDLLRIISQFPMSLPLIVPSVTKNGEFHVLYPLLQSVRFKWETGLKKVKHNSLFTTSFRMIAAVRLGEAKPGKPGKSTIINQLFHTPYIFSSVQEPGASRGKPVSLPGFVEFVVLSQDTCKESLWHSVISQHYQTQADDVLLLANVHGDAVFYSDTIRLLKQLNCEFVVFLMAQDCEKAGENLAAFEDIIGKGVEESSVLVVDSSSADIGDFYDEVNKIDTSQLTDDSTLRKVRQVLKNALDKQGVCAKIPNLHPDINNIFVAEKIVTKESQALIDFAMKKTCRKIKNTFKLQKTKNFDMSIWHNDRNLQHLINMFAKILILPLNLRRMGVHHLDREISSLSSEESAQCREKILMLKEQFRSTIDLRDQQFELQAIKNKLNQEYAKLDTTSLGLEHFFRELGRVYEFAEYTSDSTVTTDNSLHLCMPEMCAELLVDGTAIEILDGDISHINSSWFTCVCKHIHLKYPNLSIFVISVLGLQSSGKSTLLNVLFGCKFAVSAGRCTRGLFMRLLFLDELLAKELGIDAVILIDTEGLGAPEKMNEANAEKNDRLMATFAMSISNLTIINVLGEAYRSLTEILQIVIITMARLDKAEMSPDVLMVQHVSERDESKLMLGADKFCEALQQAIVLVSKESMKLGANECKSLKTLVARVRKGELLKIFRAFKSGATLNAPPSQEYLDDANSLYTDILQAAKNSGKSTLFKRWYSLLPVYWEEISAENFALNFKNIKDVQEFIDRDQNISQMKQAIYLAFQHHRDVLEKQCRAKTNEELKNNSSLKWNQIKEKLFRDAEIDMKSVPQTCKSNNNFPCEACNDSVMKMRIFFKQVENQYYKVEITSTIHKYISNVRTSMMTELKQMVKAMEVKLEKFTEFETIINGILEKKLAKKSQYSDIERQGIVAEIWSTLVRTVSDENKIASVEERIKDQVRKVYTDNLNMEKAFQNPYYEPLDIPTTKPWYSVETTCLSFEQANQIRSYLEKLPHVILKENNEEKFEDWMVKRLDDEIQQYLNCHKKQFRSGLSAEVKVKIHQNGIRIFTLVMKNIELIWRSNNDPLVILKNKEKDYMDIINVRLQYGFDIDGEGRLMADAVLKAIRKLSQNAAERKQCDLVLTQLWITNSENVRLKYFTRLITQVDKGDKKEAMEFFCNPKESIEDWFTNEVNSFTSDSVLKEYTSVSQKEYTNMKNQIESFETCTEILEYILNYVGQVEGVDYKCRMEFHAHSDVESLKRIIISSLISGSGNLTENIEIQEASMQDIVMNRLGCTESCPACRSLCWGERGHDQNADDTNKHHTTHQPTGLGAWRDHDTLELKTTSCDKRAENLNVYINGGNQPPVLWKNVKELPEYINWGFGTHFKTRFSKLMKWFLLQLHEDIAETYNCKPISSQDLQNGGFFFIELPQIMAEMKSQI